jgi:hypothetical protein
VTDVDDRFAMTPEVMAKLQGAGFLEGHATEQESSAEPGDAGESSLAEPKGRSASS